MMSAIVPPLQTDADMIKAICEAGRTPAQRNAFYAPIKVWNTAATAAEAEPPSGESKASEDHLARE